MTSQTQLQNMPNKALQQVVLRKRGGRTGREGLRLTNLFFPVDQPSCRGSHK